MSTTPRPLTWGPALSAVLVAGVLTGCTTPAPEPATTALVLGNHMGAIPYESSWVIERLPGIAEHPGEFTVITNHGTPASVGTITLRSDTSASWNQDAAEQGNRTKVNKLITAAAPVQPESSPVKALIMATQAVRQGPDPHVVIIDNGLSTSSVDGILMQEGVLTPSWDIDATITAIGPLPTLDGIPITWMGLCQTEEPQPGCPPWAEAKLTDFWTKLITGNGGTVTFDGRPATAAKEPRDLPKVAPVPFQQPAPPTPSSTDTPPSAPTLDPSVVSLSQSTLRFKENEPIYFEDKLAVAEITRVVVMLTERKHATVEIQGCVNDDGSPADALKELGTQRAERVAQDMLAAGLTIQPRVWSDGADCPGYVPGGGEANMRVIITGR